MRVSAYGQDGLYSRDPYFDGIKNKDNFFDMDKYKDSDANQNIQRKATIAKTDNKVTLTPEELSQITGLGTKINLYI